MPVNRDAFAAPLTDTHVPTDFIPLAATSLTSQKAIDPEFAASAPAAMLMFANGFKTDNSGRSEHMRREGDGPGFGTERIAARPDVFRLAKVGAGEAPVLLNGECGSGSVNQGGTGALTAER